MSLSTALKNILRSFCIRGGVTKYPEIANALWICNENQNKQQFIKISENKTKMKQKKVHTAI